MGMRGSAGGWRVTLNDTMFERSQCHSARKPIPMPRKMSTPQKKRRTLQGTDPSDGRLGKRPVKTPRAGEKQIKGDKRIRKEQG
jgi:hypothetical protein